MQWLPTLLRQADFGKALLRGLASRLEAHDTPLLLSECS